MTNGPLNSAGIADLGTKPSALAVTPEIPEDQSRLAPPVKDPEPLPPIDDAILLQIMQRDYEKSKTARETRARLNRRNWDALHGKFDFLAKKRPGQSQIVIPSLETSLEQVCAQLTEKTVGFANWFAATYEGDKPPLPGLSADEAVRILRIELERLAVDSGCMPTTYGMHRLLYDSWKIGLIESEVTWKVMMEPEETPSYTVQNGQLITSSTESMRLRVDLVPFEDFFPDPTSAKQYMIHEIELPISELPDLGFSPEQIDQMRHAAPGVEKLEQQRRRAGIAHGMPSPHNRVLLREYWGDLTHPQTGMLIAKDVTFMTAANTTVVKRPERIRDLFWPGLRPFIHVPLIPTPTAEQHHAFCDIAVPLIEAECELFNLVTDAGFHGALGVKQIRSYGLVDQTVIAKGLTTGMELEVNNDFPVGAQVVEKCDTGTLTADMLQVFDRISRTRQEATRTNDLQLGRQAMRKTSATEINEITEASDDLFSNMALRFEVTAIDPLLELCWLFLWQFADEEMIHRIGSAIPQVQGEILALMTPEERFAAFATGVSFKAHGFQDQLQSTKAVQTVMMLNQQATQNPALAQILQTEISPIKFFKMVLRSRGIDPEDLRPDPDEPQLNPQLMQGQAGNPQAGPSGTNPTAAPLNAAMEGSNTPPNPMGERGPQMP